MKTEFVKLHTARCVQNFASHRDGTPDYSRPTTISSQAINDIVPMPVDEAQRYIERGMASAAKDPNLTQKGQ